MKNRTIDLVIKDERIMTCFIKFLIHSLHTVDGNANSSLKIEEILFSQMLRDSKRDTEYSDQQW
jgi:hypothetical protein